jgi:integrase
MFSEERADSFELPIACAWVKPRLILRKADPGSGKRATQTRQTSNSLGSRDQIERVRAKIETHSDAGLQTLRDTFLTEAAEYTDPFRLQYVAGHKNIKTTMRYVHPQANAVDKLFGRFGQMRRGGDKNGYMENSSKS